MVTRLTDYGAFVALDGQAGEPGGGGSGLVHLSEISWEALRHPSDALRAGQRVRVAVLSVAPGERRSQPRVGLSLRTLLPDPTKETLESVLRSAVAGDALEPPPGLPQLVELLQARSLGF